MKPDNVFFFFAYSGVQLEYSRAANGSAVSFTFQMTLAPCVEVAKKEKKRAFHCFVGTMKWMIQQCSKVWCQQHLGAAAQARLLSLYSFSCLQSALKPHPHSASVAVKLYLVTTYHHPL